MPAFDTKPVQHDSAREFLERFARPADSDLAHQVAALRAEVRELVDFLRPSASPILTGAAVVAEFKRLAGGAQ